MNRRRGTVLLAMALACLVAGRPIGSRAQAPPAPRPGEFDPWARVLSANDKWIVLENRQGQQFPVSLDAIRLFVIRWPTTPDRISPASLIEATGIDRNQNSIMTDHVDVFEGAARSMVTPGLVYVQGANYAERPIDFTFNAAAYGAPYPGLDWPIQGGIKTDPERIHVVGPVVSVNPLAVAFQATNRIVILPPPQGIFMTQVTPGSTGFVRPGDIAYYAPVEARAKSLVLDQLVIYKGMPLDQFVP